jgi:hypothetical protein
MNKNTCRRNKYLTTTDINDLSVTKRYRWVTKTSKYPLHLLFIDQDFTVKWAQIFLGIQYIFDMPTDVMCYMFMWMYRDKMCIKYADDVDSAYENYTKIITTDQLPKSKFCDNWTTWRLKDKCFRCKYTVGSLRCNLHITCDLCGFNMRFDNCIHSERLIVKSNAKYKINEQQYNLQFEGHGKIKNPELTNDIPAQSVEELYSENNEKINDQTSLHSAYIQIGSQSLLNADNIPQQKLVACDEYGLVVHSTDKLYCNEIYSEKFDESGPYGCSSDDRAKCNCTTTGITSVATPEGESDSQRKYRLLVRHACKQRMFIWNMKKQFDKLHNDFLELKLKMEYAMNMQEDVDKSIDHDMSWNYNYSELW